MIIKADYSQVKEGFDPAKPGTYVVRVMECTYAKNKNDEPYLKWLLKIFNADDHKQNGKIIIHSTNLAGKFAVKTKQIITAIDEVLDINTFDTDDLLGKTLECTVARRKNDLRFVDVTAVAAYVEKGSLSGEYDAGNPLE